MAEAKPEFDEFLAIRFKVTSEPPYPFEWVDYNVIRLDYAAALSRISVTSNDSVQFFSQLSRPLF